jgi:hypothetical protein
MKIYGFQADAEPPLMLNQLCWMAIMHACDSAGVMCLTERERERERGGGRGRGR